MLQNRERIETGNFLVAELVRRNFAVGELVADNLVKGIPQWEN